MTVLNAVGAVVGLTQSMVVAFFFGTTRGVEIFFAAVALEASIIQLTQTGQLAEIFLPIYHRVKHAQGVAEAYGCFAVMINIVLALVAVLAVIMYGLAPILVKLRVPGFSVEDMQTTVVVFRALLPLLGIHVTLAMLHTLANAEKWFGAPEAITIATRIAGVVVLAALAPAWGIWALVTGLYVNTAGALLALCIFAFTFGYRHRLRLKHSSVNLVLLMKQLATTLFYVATTQCYAFAFDAGLSYLPQGVFAVFKYVQQHLVAKSFAILLRPINIVFYTHFSEALTQGSNQVTALTRRALSLSLAASVLVVVGFLAAGEPLLQGIWGGRRFSPEEIQLATNFATIMFAMLLVTATGQVYRRMAMSLGMVRSVYAGYSIVQIACALLAVVILPAAGIAGAFSIVALNMAGLAAVPLLLVALRRRDLMAFYSPGEAVKWTIAAGLGLAIVLAATSIGITQWFGTDRVSHIALAVLLFTLTTGTTLAGAWVMQVAEVRNGARRVKSLFWQTSSVT